MTRFRALIPILGAFAILGLAACSSTASTPTPSPSPTTAPTSTPTATSGTTPTPTPTQAVASPIGNPPPGYQLYVDAKNGFGFHYPDSWQQNTVPDTLGADVVVQTSDGTVQIGFYTGIEAANTAGTLRLDQTANQFISALGQPKDTQDQPNVTLDNGTTALRRDLLYGNSETAKDVHLYLITDALRTYVITVTGSTNVLDRNSDTIDRVVKSFVAFQPARFGVPRELSITMAGDDPITLDPAMSREVTSHLYVSNIFAGLVRFDQSLTIQLDLAKSVTVDSTGTVYTFVLRDDAKFQDGRPITAEDVRYSLERATDPALKSPTAALYLGDIVGVKEKLAGKASSVSGIKVVNDRTIQLTIDSPKAYFLAKLTYPTAYIVDRNNIEGRGPDWWKGPINGSGPFKLKEWNPGKDLILQRFDGYHNPAKVPYVVFAINLGTPLQLYQAGITDVATIGGSEIDQVKDPASGITGKVSEFPQFMVSYVGFNVQKPPFDDPKVRLAFAMALNRQDLIDVVYGSHVELAKGLLPPGLPGYNPNLRTIPYDPAQAKKLLSESKYAQQYASGNFPDVVFTTAASGGISPDIQYMIGQWQDNLGITVSVRGLDPSTYYYALKNNVDNLYDYGWVADYPDPQDFLDALLYSGSTENNIGGYSNPAFDKLIEEARSEADQAKRMALYQQAEQLMLDDAAIIPIYTAPDYELVAPYVDGFYVSPLGVPILTNVQILPH